MTTHVPDHPYLTPRATHGTTEEVTTQVPRLCKSFTHTITSSRSTIGTSCCSFRRSRSSTGNILAIKRTHDWWAILDGRSRSSTGSLQYVYPSHGTHLFLIESRVAGSAFCKTLEARSPKPEARSRSSRFLDPG